MPTTTLAPTQKRRRGEAIIRDGGTGQFTSTGNPILPARSSNTNEPRVEPEEEPQEADDLASDRILNQSWWESNSDNSFFGELRVVPEEEEEEEEEALDIKAVVRKRIQRLRQGHTSCDGWKLTLDDLDTKGICTANDIFDIQMKCKYVAIALRLALCK